MALLDHLPVAAIDLNALAAERLQRFLDAFSVEIHYDGRTRRVRVQAEIAAELVAELAHKVGWAGGPRAVHSRKPGSRPQKTLAPSTEFKAGHSL